MFFNTDFQKILKHFGKSKENVAYDVGVVSKWLKTQDHLPEIPGDTMITYFLVNTNFSIEKTKQSLDVYYTVKTILPGIFHNTLPLSSNMKAIYEEILLVPLPTLTPKLQRVIWSKLNGDPANFIGDQAIAMMTHINEVRIWEDVSLGDIYIVDYSNVKLGHAKITTPQFFKKLDFIIEEVWSNQVKELHIINPSNVADVLISLLRKYLYKSLREKIFVHESLTDLYKFIPREILPKEYGGNEKSLQDLGDAWRETLQKHRPRFEKLENMAVQEDRRPSPCKNCDILGYYGNYMKIDVNKLVNKKMSFIKNVQKIFTHFGKSKENVAHDVGVIKNWLQSQAHLPEMPADTMITYFIVNSNFSIEKTKQSLDMYYSVRTIMPDIFQNTLPFSPTVKSVYDEITLVPLPSLTATLQRVVFVKVNGDPERLSGDLALVTMTHMNEVRIWEDLSLGDIYILDYRKLNLSYVKKATPQYFKKLDFICEEVWNNQIKELHIINASSSAEVIIALLRKYLYTGLRNKVFVHESLTDLYKVVPREILPEEYGGDEPSLNDLKDSWYKTLQKHHSRFEKLENMVVQENRRPSACKNCDILGYYGNYMRIDSSTLTGVLTWTIGLMANIGACEVKGISARFESVSIILSSKFISNRRQVEIALSLKFDSTGFCRSEVRKNGRVWVRTSAITKLFDECMSDDKISSEEEYPSNEELTRDSQPDSEHEVMAESSNDDDLTSNKEQEYLYRFSHIEVTVKVKGKVNMSFKTDFQKIFNHFGKSKANVVHDVEIIKSWIKTQNHLPEIPADTMITYFLVNNNFSIEKCKQSLDMYYSVRTIMPDIYQNNLPLSSTTKGLYEEVTTLPLPTLTPNFQRVIVCKINGNPEKLDGDQPIVLMTHFNEVKIWEDLSLGDIYVLDYKNLKLGHVAKVTPQMFKKVDFICEEVWNNQIKEMHIINAPSVADAIITVMRKYLYRRLREKVFVHTSLSDLYKYVPREILPKDYGGDEKPMNELKDLWYKTLQKHQPRFEKLENMVVQENRRPSPCKNCDILGYYGNYMQIDVN
ncbi:uncharacterized protein [Diabrotica undecimpunctata]|uniref:uncharacterized protein n=1 Tax=Diabrotica undecimpunctata TaxID=50387 RepID=UPI003B639375